MSLEVLEVYVPRRKPADVEERLKHPALPAPRSLDEGAHHVRAVQQRARGPELAVVRPARLDPIDRRRPLPQRVDNQTWAGGRFAVEDACFPGGHDAATNGEEGAALVEDLANEGYLSVARLLAHAGTHKRNVKRWARRKRVLGDRPVSIILSKQVSGSDCSTYGWLDLGCALHPDWLPILGDPVELNIDGILPHLLGKVHYPTRGLIRPGEELKGRYIEHLGDAVGVSVVCENGEME